MKELKKVNFSIPPEAQALIEDLRGGLGGKEKWIVVTAGLLLLAEASITKRNELYSRIKSYQVPGREFSKLIGEFDQSIGKAIRARFSPGTPRNTKEGRTRTAEGDS